MRNRKIFQNNI